MISTGSTRANFSTTILLHSIYGEILEWFVVDLPSNPERYLERDLEVSHPAIAKRIYFFNTFFYERLTSRSSGKRGINYEGVQKWTSKIDIFNFDYVVVPVNER
jgi:hypothetical protein